MYKRQPRILFVDCEPGLVLHEVSGAAQAYAEGMFEWRELLLGPEIERITVAVTEDLNWADLIVLLDARGAALAEFVPAGARLKSWYDDFSSVVSIENLRQLAASRVQGMAGGIRMLSRLK